MACPDALLVHAYCDGELDAPAAVALEQHLAGCAACRALQHDVESLRRALRSSASYHRLEPARRARLLGALPGARRTAPRPFLAGALTGLAVAAGAAAVALLVPGLGRSPAARDALSAHVRSLVSERLIDVASSDRHTVKPWFAGRVEISPPVADFTAQGYPLVGGRVDFVDGHRAATLVYRRGAHVISVFAWPAGGGPLPRLESRGGYQVACWARAAIDYCAVSDTAGEELLALTQLLKMQGDAAPGE